jgi:hypothetical protein
MAKYHRRSKTSRHIRLLHVMLKIFSNCYAIHHRLLYLPLRHLVTSVLIHNCSFQSSSLPEAAGFAAMASSQAAGVPTSIL